jgi:hypothetical protein
MTDESDPVPNLTPVVYEEPDAIPRVFEDDGKFISKHELGVAQALKRAGIDFKREHVIRYCYSDAVRG